MCRLYATQTAYIIVPVDNLRINTNLQPQHPQSPLKTPKLTRIFPKTVETFLKVINKPLASIQAKQEIANVSIDSKLTIQSSNHTGIQICIRCTENSVWGVSVDEIDQDC